VNCFDSYGDGWSTGHLKIAEDHPNHPTKTWQKFCGNWKSGTIRTEKMQGQTDCLADIKAATINIDKFASEGHISSRDTTDAVSTAIMGVIGVTSLIAPMVFPPAQLAGATGNAFKIGMHGAGFVAGENRIRANDGELVSDQTGETAKVVKDVMEETIDEVYADMSHAQDLLAECLNQRMDQQAEVLRVEMVEYIFSKDLHDKYIHAENRLAAAVEYVTEDNQAVSFAANAVEEGLRGCYDIRALTELLSSDNLLKALEESFLVENWFTICLQFSKMVEYLSSWGDIVPFKAQFQTDKYMAEAFLTYFTRMKHVAANQSSTSGSVTVVRQFEYRIRNHLNEIKIKHQHALLGFDYPRRQPSVTFPEKLVDGNWMAGSFTRHVELGENMTFNPTCRRCVRDLTGFDERDGQEIRYWCWEEKPAGGFDACLDLDGIYFNHETELSNAQGCRIIGTRINGGNCYTPS